MTRDSSTTRQVEAGPARPVHMTNDALPPLAAGSSNIGDVDIASALPAGEAHLGQVGGSTVKRNSTITRPNDTTAYAAGDVVNSSPAAAAEILGCGRVNGGSGLLLNAMLIDSALAATPGQYEVWIFDTAIAPDADNAVFTPTDGELATLVAIIPLVTSYIGDATSGAAGNRVYLSEPVNRGFVCAGGSTTLYWALVVRNVYTPVALEQFTLRVTIVQD